MFLNIRRKIPVHECPFHQLKSIFIQKETPALVFSWCFFFNTVLINIENVDQISSQI